MEEMENPEIQEVPPTEAELRDAAAMEGPGLSKQGMRLLDPDVVKRMKEAGLPRPPDVSSLTWDQIQHMSPGRHHTIAYMAACGASQKDIAEAVGMSQGQICIVINSEKVKFQISQIQHKLFGMNAQKRFMAILPKAVDTIEKIMDDEQCKPAIRLNAAVNLVDRAVGKPQQKIEVGGSLIRQLFEKLDEKHKVIDTEPVSTRSESVMEEIFEDCALGPNPNEVEHADPSENPNKAESDVKIGEWVGENL